MEALAEVNFSTDIWTQKSFFTSMKEGQFERGEVLDLLVQNITLKFSSCMIVSIHRSL